MDFRPIVAASAVALASATCSPAPGWQGTIEERDGVVYVSNPREGLWQHRTPVPIRFELEQTFGVDLEPKDEILGATGWHGVAIDGDGNVYVYDYGFAEIFSFAPDGSLRWRAGGPGQGPGEIFDAEGLAWDGGSSIYLSNASLKRLDRWSTDGEFLDAHALADRDLPSGTLLGLLDSATAVVQGRLASRVPGPAAGGVIGIIDLTPPWTSVIETSVDVASGELRFSGYKIDMKVSGGYITVGDFDSYEWRIFDRTGRLIRVVSRSFEEMVGYPVVDEQSAPYSALAAPVLLPTGHWLASASWVDVEDPAADWRQRSNGPRSSTYPRRSSVDLFDAEGRFLYSMETDGDAPAIGRPTAVGPDGKLYTRVFEPFPHVRRYRVEVDQ